VAIRNTVVWLALPCTSAGTEILGLLAMVRTTFLSGSLSLRLANEIDRECGGPEDGYTDDWAQDIYPSLFLWVQV
jgi:hypothetical protein